MPTNDFYARSVVSTYAAVAIFVAAGGWSGWRSRSFRTCALTGAAIAVTAAVVVSLTTAGALAVRHDPHTMRMIAASGGLDEAFFLPFMAIIPGTATAMIAGAVGKSLASSLERRRQTSRR